MTPYRKRQVDRLIADAVRADRKLVREPQRTRVYFNGEYQVVIGDDGTLTGQQFRALNVPEARARLGLEP